MKPISLLVLACLVAAYNFDVHDMYALVRLDAHGGQWLRLTGNWPTFGGGQKAHFHPQLTGDRKWILVTGGGPASRTNHIFLLHVSDLHDSEGIRADLLSPTGANDLVPWNLPSRTGL